MIIQEVVVSLTSFTGGIMSGKVTLAFTRKPAKYLNLNARGYLYRIDLVALPKKV
jgi:hypothetical protein